MKWTDIKTIESDALTKMYNRETFFSIFSEQSAILHVVITKLKPGTINSTYSMKRQQSVNRTLGFVLDRPTTVMIELN